MISKKAIVKSCMYYRGISISLNKIGRAHNVLSFETVWIFKVGMRMNLSNHL